MRISIHAAREGGDYYSWRFVPDTGISIHAAREGGDVSEFDATLLLSAISIHAAREGGDSAVSAILSKSITISIHAAREGGDGSMRSMSRNTGGFQSTPPVKAATAETYKCNQHSRKQQV